MKLSSRTFFFILFFGCTALLGFGLYLQYIGQAEPCPMCIMQRYAFILITLIAFIAAIHKPARTGLRFYSLLLFLTGITGTGIAARQSWLQFTHIPSEFGECGPDMAYLINNFPISEALPMIFSGTGDCSKVDWTFLGLSIANWSFFCFSAITFLAVMLFLGKLIHSTR